MNANIKWHKDMTPDEVRSKLSQIDRFEMQTVPHDFPFLCMHYDKLYDQSRQEQEKWEAIERAISRLLSVSFSPSEVRLLLVMSSGHETEASRAIHARCDELAEAQTALRAALQPDPQAQGDVEDVGNVRVAEPRQAANRKLIAGLSDVVEAHPDLRFGQILLTHGFLITRRVGTQADCVEYIQDPFNEESVTTLERASDFKAQP